jgi:hypothetical protein
MMKSPGHRPRNLLAAAILTALAGSALAAEPSLRVLTPITGGTLDRVVELASVRYEPGSRSLVASTDAGNFDCGTATAPAAGELKLVLDGKSYAVRTSALPTGLPQPILYSPAGRQFTLSLLDITSTSCASTGVTAFDLVVLGADGTVTARSRIGEAVQLYLPNGTAAPQPVVAMSVADPIRCESYGIDAGGIDHQLTGANGEPQLLFGFDRIDYRLQADSNGRRELRHVPKLSASGLPLVQCTSPGYKMGSEGAGGAAPDTLFASGFEAPQAAADVRLTLASDWLQSSLPVVGVSDGRRLGFRPVEDADGVYLTLTVRNAGVSTAVGVKVREYLRTATTDIHVEQGAEAVACTSLPADASPDPCAALFRATGADGTDPLAFPLALDIARLKAGHGFELRLHRQLQVPGGSSATQLAVGYAAFVNPITPAEEDVAADATLGNNAQWVDFAVS